MFKNSEHQRKLCNFMANLDNFLFVLLAECTSTVSPEEDNAAMKCGGRASILFMPRLLLDRTTARGTTWEDVPTQNTLLRMPIAGKENRAMTGSRRTWATIQAQANTPGMNLLFLTLCPAFFVTAFCQLQRGQSGCQIKFKINLSLILIF